MSHESEYGTLAEFGSAEGLLEAGKQLRERGYMRLEAYTSFPVEGLAAVLGPAKRRIPLFMLLGGSLGAILTLSIQYYSAVINYPINVGGRPAASWAAFVPAALEMTILFAALSGVLGMLVCNGLPRLHHPLFGSARFEAASRDGLFLLVRASDPQYEPARVRTHLEDLQAVYIERVAA